MEWYILRKYTNFTGTLLCHNSVSNNVMVWVHFSVQLVGLCTKRGIVSTHFNDAEGPRRRDVILLVILSSADVVS